MTLEARLIFLKRLCCCLVTSEITTLILYNFTYYSGYFVPDMIVAAVVGLVTGWCVGPTLPVTSQWLARSSIINFLLQISVVGLALATQLFPYSNSAPKRVVFQQTFVTAGYLQILQTD
jgi:hypothetical protein